MQQLIKRTLITLALFSVFGMVGTASKASAQSCVTSLFTGMTTQNYRPFILLTQQKNGSYAVSESANFDLTGIGKVSATGGGYFSDRVNWASNPYQPFDATRADSRRVTVLSTGSLLVENLTAGTSETVTSPICLGSIIVWSTPTRIYSLAYGSLQTPVQ